MTDFSFFWGKKDVFSNFYMHKDKKPMIVDGDCSFFSSEQYFMHAKAIFFEEPDIAEFILKETTPKGAKEWGRKITKFDKTVWDENCLQFMKKALMLKFSQNEDLKQALLATKGKRLVEASPYDTIWGIGLKADDPRAQDESQWLGQNLLGQCLDEVREEISKSMK